MDITNSIPSPTAVTELKVPPYIQAFPYADQAEALFALARTGEGRRSPLRRREWNSRYRPFAGENEWKPGSLARVLRRLRASLAI